MGVRVAKFENEDTWVVYQSTSGSMFVPMFASMMAAELFASLQAHEHKMLDAGDGAQMRLASMCAEFIGCTFGDAGAGSVPAPLERELLKAVRDAGRDLDAYDFDDLSADVERGTREVLAVLRSEFWKWEARRARNASRAVRP